MRRTPTDGTRAWKRPAVLAGTGVLALSVGLLVYLADRQPARAMLVPELTAFGGRHLFGTLGQWLPSFVHPLAFSLFTAAVLPHGAATCWFSCLFWAMVNVLFEFGQHPALRATWAAALHGGAGDGPLARPLLNYFVRGTFDLNDIGAALLGALAAGAVLHFVDRPASFPGAHHASQ